MNLHVNLIRLRDGRNRTRRDRLVRWRDAWKPKDEDLAVKYESEGFETFQWVRNPAIIGLSLFGLSSEHLLSRLSMAVEVPPIQKA